MEDARGLFQMLWRFVLFLFCSVLKSRCPICTGFGHRERGLGQSKRRGPAEIQYGEAGNEEVKSRKSMKELVVMAMLLAGEQRYIHLLLLMK